MTIVAEKKLCHALVIKERALFDIFVHAHMIASLNIMHDQDISRLYSYAGNAKFSWIFLFVF